MTKRPYNGVAGYDHYVLDVYMPAGRMACKWCPNLKYDHDTNCHRCKMTWRAIDNFDVGTDQACVLKLVERFDDGMKNDYLTEDEPPC